MMKGEEGVHSPLLSPPRSSSSNSSRRSRGRLLCEEVEDSCLISSTTSVSSTAAVVGAPRHDDNDDARSDSSSLPSTREEKDEENFSRMTSTDAAAATAVDDQKVTAAVTSKTNNNNGKKKNQPDHYRKTTTPKSPAASLSLKKTTDSMMTTVLMISDTTTTKTPPPKNYNKNKNKKIQQSSVRSNKTSHQQQQDTTTTTSCSRRRLSLSLSSAAKLLSSPLLGGRTKKDTTKTNTNFSSPLLGGCTTGSRKDTKTKTTKTTIPQHRKSSRGAAARPTSSSSLELASSPPKKATTNKSKPKTPIPKHKQQQSDKDKTGDGSTKETTTGATTTTPPSADHTSTTRLLVLSSRARSAEKSLLLSPLISVTTNNNHHHKKKIIETTTATSSLLLAGSSSPAATGRRRTLSFATSPTLRLHRRRALTTGRRLPTTTKKTTDSSSTTRDRSAATTPRRRKRLLGLHKEFHRPLARRAMLKDLHKELVLKPQQQQQQSSLEQLLSVPLPKLRSSPRLQARKNPSSAKEKNTNESSTASRDQHDENRTEDWIPSAKGGGRSRDGTSAEVSSTAKKVRPPKRKSAPPAGLLAEEQEQSETDEEDIIVVGHSKPNNKRKQQQAKNRTDDKKAADKKNNNSSNNKAASKTSTPVRRSTRPKRKRAAQPSSFTTTTTTSEPAKEQDASTLFCKKQRPKIEKEFPDLSHVQITAKVRALWASKATTTETNVPREAKQRRLLTTTTTKATAASLANGKTKQRGGRRNAGQGAETRDTTATRGRSTKTAAQPTNHRRSKSAPLVSTTSQQPQDSLLSSFVSVDSSDETPTKMLQQPKPPRGRRRTLLQTSSSDLVGNRIDDGNDNDNSSLTSLSKQKPQVDASKRHFVVDKSSQPAVVVPSTSTQRGGSVPVVIAKSIPRKGNDGTFLRPSGKAPTGHHWDAIHGCWVATTITPTLVDSSRLPNRADNNIQVPGELTHATPADRLALLPRSTPRQSRDGIFVRPSGKNPAGRRWDSLHGYWVLESVDDAAHHNAVSADAGNSLIDVQRSAQEEQEGRTQVSQSYNAVLTDSVMPLGTKGRRSLDGTFPRPSSKAPAGHRWDERRGSWVQKKNSGTAQVITRKSDEPDSSNRDRKDGLKDEKTRSIRTQTTSADSSVILPKTRPRRNRDGTFSRPQGRAPEGKRWDSTYGCWVHEATNSAVETIAIKAHAANSDDDDRTASEGSRNSKEAEIFSSPLTPRQNEAVDSEFNLKTADEAVAVSERKVTSSKGVSNETKKKSRRADAQLVETRRSSSRPSRIQKKLRLSVNQEVSRSLSQNKDRKFRRPPGKAPGEKAWDPKYGCWKALETNNQKGRKADESSLESKRPNKRDSSDHYAHGPELKRARKSRSPLLQKDKCLLPESVPLKNPDGSYRRPSGRSPKGYTWNSLRGFWKPLGSGDEIVADARSSEPRFVACGSCVGCKSTTNCGSCLQCMRLMDMPSSPRIHVVCMQRVCSAPIPNPNLQTSHSKEGTDQDCSTRHRSRSTAAHRGEPVNLPNSPGRKARVGATKHTAVKGSGGSRARNPSPSRNQIQSVLLSGGGSAIHRHQQADSLTTFMVDTETAAIRKNSAASFPLGTDHKRSKEDDSTYEGGGADESSTAATVDQESSSGDVVRKKNVRQVVSKNHGMRLYDSVVESFSEQSDMSDLEEPTAADFARQFRRETRMGLYSG